MTTEQAISYYTTQKKLATALGIAQSTVAGWGHFPPAIRQIQIERLTKSKLRAEPGILDVKKRAA